MPNPIDITKVSETELVNIKGKEPAMALFYKYKPRRR